MQAVGAISGFFPIPHSLAGVTVALRQNSFNAWTLHETLSFPSLGESS